LFISTEKYTSSTLAEYYTSSAQQQFTEDGYVGERYLPVTP